LWAVTFCKNSAKLYIPIQSKYILCVKIIRQSLFLTVLFLLLSASLIAAGAVSPSQDAAGLSQNGTAFLDADGDGFFSPGEMGLANSTIRLILDGTEISNTSRTYALGKTFLYHVL